MGKPSTNRFGTLPRRKPNRHRLGCDITPMVYPEGYGTEEQRKQVRDIYQSYRDSLLRRHQKTQEAEDGRPE